VLPIAGLAGDQQSALFGQGCTTPGAAKITYGTGAFLLAYTGTERVRSKRGLLTTAAVAADGSPAFAVEGSVFIAGAAVQWLRDGLGIIATAAETESLARSVPDTGGVTFVPTFAGLGTPHWEAEARGTIVGLTRGTSRAHIVRAALEAMAHSSADLIGSVIADAKEPPQSLRVDGGASANDWLMQFQADVLGVPVERPDVVETTALGAAGLAGLALGVWRTAAEFQQGRGYTRFTPTWNAAERARHRQAWERAIGATLHWARGGKTP
jgi:glycerol kinase